MTIELYQLNMSACRACPSRVVADRSATCRHTGRLVGRHARIGDCPENKLQPAPSDKPGTPFANTIVCQSGANCSLCRQVEGGREWRRSMKKKYPTPGGLVDFNCPHAKPWNGAGTAANDGRKHFVIKAHQGAGDLVSLSGAIRDLHLSYPGQFATAVRTGRLDLFAHNPHVLPEAKVAGKVVRVGVYPGEYQTASGHMGAEFHRKLSQAVGVQIPVLSDAGDVHLSDAEKAEPPEIEGPYWVAWFGGKHDFTVKWWPPKYMQQLVDRLAGRVKFVRVGAGGWQPPLTGVIDAGDTSFRRLARLMYHAQGGIGPVSFGMHLAAAVPTPDGRVRPFVVLAGGGETPGFYQYPGHTVLHTIGRLPCCTQKGCWKFKAEIRGTPVESPDCALPIAVDESTVVAKCMTLLTPERVAEAIERAIAAPPIFPEPIDAALQRWIDENPEARRPVKRPADDVRWAERGPQMWGDLHRRPFLVPTLDAAAEKRWMDQFNKHVFCGECRAHWRALLAATPPDYSSREAYFAWTVDSHNQVNRRLGKPIVSVTVATQMMESEGCFFEEAITR